MNVNSPIAPGDDHHIQTRIRITTDTSCASGSRASEREISQSSILPMKALKDKKGFLKVGVHSHHVALKQS